MKCKILGELILKVKLYSCPLSHCVEIECTFIVLSRQLSGTEIEKMIGDVNVFLNDPEDPSRVELDVMIAEVDFRGKGCGKEAVLLMMSYCVHELQILKFYCKIHEENKSSLSLFQRHDPSLCTP
jgi:RimJ/RimL family protein N-acetyltransferase